MFRGALEGLSVSAIPEPPHDRFCDLVMKGGIASGVVYPKAIGLLARHYRFKSIGGTSAGAIAAVVTAAAEYQRRVRDGARDGYLLLEQLPSELQRNVGGTGKRKLLSLFQPQPGAHRLFSVLICSLNSKGTYRRILRIASGFLLAYWPATLGCAVLAAAVGAFGAGWFSAALVLMLALPVSIGLWVYFDLTHRIVDNGFGMCTGLTEHANHEALTPWLHTLIQAAAGRQPGEAPLTFGDLWDAPGFPPDWVRVPVGVKPRSIDLQMFTTNLAHGRPYVFPLGEPDPGPSRFRAGERLYFKPRELARYLPDDVLTWMVSHAKPYTVEPGRRGIDPDETAADGALELPEPRHFPVLLAARMSLSFPLLFAAVPLHAIDHDAPVGARRFRCCWFSDGGISSNFPMHLFDGLVPQWPTFGINLETKIEGQEMVYLPTRYEEGYGERWTRFAEAPRSASRFGGFIGAIVGAMQNWNDNSLARMPGVRDRVARVRLEHGEGGINLDMGDTLIGSIAAKGEQAAHLLVRRFAQTRPDGRQADGWDEHRLVRLHVLLKMIEARAPGVLNALSPNCGHATDFNTLLANAMRGVDAQGGPMLPAGYEQALTPTQTEALSNAIQALGQMAATLSDPANANAFKPIPKPELRVRPPL